MVFLFYFSITLLTFESSISVSVCEKLKLFIYLLIYCVLKRDTVAPKTSVALCVNELEFK